MVKFIITFIVTMWCLGIVLTSLGSHALEQKSDYSFNSNFIEIYDNEHHEIEIIYCFGPIHENKKNFNDWLYINKDMRWEFSIH